MGAERAETTVVFAGASNCDAICCPATDTKALPPADTRPGNAFSITDGKAGGSLNFNAASSTAWRANTRSRKLAKVPLMQMRPRKRNLPSVGAERAETADVEVAGGAAEVAPSKTGRRPVKIGNGSGSLGKDGSLGNFGKLKSSLTSWRADANQKSVNSFSYNEANEKLTRNGGSIDGGRQSEDRESKSNE